MHLLCDSPRRQDISGEKDSFDYKVTHIKLSSAAVKTPSIAFMTSNRISVSLAGISIKGSLSPSKLRTSAAEHLLIFTTTKALRCSYRCTAWMDAHLPLGCSVIPPP